MNKLIKWLLGLVGALVLLVVAAVIILPMVIDPNDYKAEIVEAVKEQTGRELVIAEPLELSVFPWLGINAGGVSLSNAPGFGEQPFASLGELNLKVKLLPLLTGTVKVDTVVLRDLSLNLARNAQGVSNWDDLAGAAPAEEKEKPEAEAGGGKVAVDIEGIELRNARLVWDDRQAKARYELKDLNLVAGALSAGSTAPIRMNFVLDTGKQGPQLSMALEGKLSVREDSLGYTMPDLSVELNGAGGGLPAPLKLTLDAKLALDLAAGSLALSDIQAKLDDSTLTGKVNVGSFAGPAVQLALQLDQLDLDRYLPPAAEEQGAAKPAAKQAAGDDPLAGLRTLDLDGQVRVGKLKVKNLHIQDIQLTVRSKNGVLKVDPLQALLYQGKLSAKAEVDARRKTPRISVVQQLSGVQAGPLLADLTGKDKLTGTGEVNADLSMSGLDEAAIRKSLNGKADFAFRDGAVKGINVAELIRNAQARLSGGTATSSGAQQTDFSELSGSATIRNGLVDNQDLTAKSPLLRIAGKGQVNLPADTVDYLLTTELVKSLEGQGGKGANDLTGLPIPVRIKGKLADPGYSVDLQTVMESKVKQEAQKKLESTLQDKAGDKVKGLLKGLGF